MKFNRIITTALLAAFSSVVFGQDVDEIVKKHETQKAADIEKYIADNPDAEDLDVAYFFLSNAQGALGEHEKALKTLETRYDRLDKGAEATIQLILQEIIAPYLRSSEAIEDNTQAIKLIDKMRDDFKDHPNSERMVQVFDQIKQRLNRPKQPKVGDSMNISFTATDGTEVDLAAMKGKVVLVDFWATWCPPCVKEMPHVVAAYEKHKDSGFDVVGISLDKEKEAMDAFTTKNKMPWVQYFDGAGWGNKLAGETGITGIPATFLIGKDGKIVNTNLRGDALDKAIIKALAAE